MIRADLTIREVHNCWPRTSGDDPPSLLNLFVITRLAPHERG